MHSIFQASRWEYAYLPCHPGLPSAIDYGGYYIDKIAKMCPIMMTLEPMHYVVEENVTCNCAIKCAIKKWSCRYSGNKCALLCLQKAKIFSWELWKHELLTSKLPLFMGWFMVVLIIINPVEQW